jgi:hypothetical protein
MRDSSVYSIFHAPVCFAIFPQTEGIVKRFSPTIMTNTRAIPKKPQVCWTPAIRRAETADQALRPWKSTHPQGKPALLLAPGPPHLNADHPRSGQEKINVPA